MIKQFLKNYTTYLIPQSILSALLFIGIISVDGGDLINLLISITIPFILFVTCAIIETYQDGKKPWKD